jgi:ATP-dependent helicase/DNAse subunit B
LEELYRDPPAPGVMPRHETLEAWRRRASELIALHVADTSLEGDDARAAMARSRMLALIEGFLGREAALPTVLRPDPELLEASFGEKESDDRPPLDLGGVKLHGKIDRVDVAEGEGAPGLIRDYKVKRVVTKGQNLEKEGKLQLQLYALALERLWGRRALGGVYVPLAGTSDHQPRGIALCDEADGKLAGLGLARYDLLEPDAFETALKQATEEARRIGLAMRKGKITRNPINDTCPVYCNFQAICRRERATRLEPERDLAEDEDEAA